MHTSSFSVVRDPDGVPHEIVGLTWLFAIAIAIGSFAALAYGGAMTAIGFGVLPIAIVTLDRRARRRRATRRQVTKSELRAEVIDWRGR
jgi:membrane protein implicated in regulation of membrane protease activity